MKHVDKDLSGQEFEVGSNPNFGSEGRDVNYRTFVQLGYDYVVLGGFPESAEAGYAQLSPGKYEFMIRNAGIESATGKNIILIEVS
jgi:hypothetical protein